MNFLPTSTTKSAKAKLALTLLGALVLIGFSAFAVLAAPAKPGFSVSAGPSSQTVAPGASAVYNVTVSRVNGFTGSVTLAASGLPAGATSSWKLNTGPASAGSITVPSSQSTATLTVQTSASTPAASSTIAIKGTSGSLTSSTSVALVVQSAPTPPPSDTAGFTIFGNLGTPLAPGVSSPLDLTLSNPNSQTLKVTNLTVQVDDATDKTACSGTQNYKVLQYRGTYPISVPPGGASLSALGVANRDQPQISMLNLATNQDPCKGAQITLRYSGTATK